jgi:hypothetical protein
MNSGVREAVMADFDDVAQRAAVECVRQQFEKAAEIGGVEFFGRRELPEQGAEMIAEFGHAGIEKALDRVAGLLQHAAIDAKRGPLSANTKPGGTSLAHLRKVAGVCER